MQRLKYRIELLRLVYEETKGDTVHPVEVGPLGERLGLSAVETVRLAGELERDRLLKMGWQPSAVNLTPEGARAIEIIIQAAEDDKRRRPIGF